MSRVVEPLPPDLDREYKGMALVNEGLQYSRHYEEARQGFQSIYSMLLERQPSGSRYHKGYPLHQIGVTLFLSDKKKQALKYFVLAFIEDLLSKGVGDEDAASNEPAGRTLRGTYGVQEASLEQLKRAVRAKKELGQTVPDPEIIYSEVASGKAPTPVVEPQETSTTGQEPREPGQFASTWEKRVFVGGNYSTHLSELHSIAKVCLAKGYDPILAKDFNTPSGRIHHHALMLLHECHMAIFEVSGEGGQLMEIERLRDYEIKPLIVCQTEAYMTKMLEELVSAQGYGINRYGIDAELVQLVEDYLG